MARKRDDTVKLVLRLPPRLHRALKRAASLGNQSLNSEMVRRLERSVELGPRTAQDYRDLRMLSDHMARQGTTEFGMMNEKLDRIIAQLEAEESKDDGEKK